ncbi:MAG: Gfo/Idh/MocA family oxidoreductase [Armatimonadetes bacterium]|nr:Gfo/Idh/MocA family oxidoreductase [Armatimonadota bacterium]
MDTKETVKVAVIGIGAFGELHARNLAALPEARLTALGNRTRSKAERLAAELGVPEVFTTVEELIDQQAAEALVIATRTDTHVPIALKALSAGMHVLVEKPVSEDLEEANDLLEISRTSDQVVMAGHICVFHSMINPLIQRVRQEGFRSLDFVRHRPRKTGEIYPEEHPIAMTMVHDLYVAAQMAGGEEPVYFDALDATNSQGLADHAWGTLRWDDGRVATFHSHWILPDGAAGDGFDRVEVFGDRYVARVDTNPQNLTWTDDKVTWPLCLEISSVEGRPTGMLAEELRSFLAACSGAPVPPGCRMEDAIQVQRWMDTLLKSAMDK